MYCFFNNYCNIWSKHILFLYVSSEESPAPEAGPSTSTGEATVVHTGEPKPVERSVEFRNTDDAMASMVRSLYFADTFIVHGKFNIGHSSDSWNQQVINSWFLAHLSYAQDEL